jgi:hypothetical protein
MTSNWQTTQLTLAYLMEQHGLEELRVSAEALEPGRVDVRHCTDVSDLADALARGDAVFNISHVENRLALQRQDDDDDKQVSFEPGNN